MGKPFFQKRIHQHILITQLVILVFGLITDSCCHSHSSQLYLLLIMIVWSLYVSV